MFITPAYAQSADGGIFGGLGIIGPLVLIFAIMYFLVIRPQRMQMKKQQDMVNATRRGDTVVTAGGLVGKVTRVFDESNEIEVEIAEDVRVRVVRSTLATVRAKGEIAKESGSAAVKEAPARRKSAATKSRTATKSSRTSTRASGSSKAVAETTKPEADAQTSDAQPSDAPPPQSDK